MSTSPKKLFGHQQNLTIPANLILNPNHKMLPKLFSESIIKIIVAFKMCPNARVGKLIKTFTRPIMICVVC